MSPTPALTIWDYSGIVAAAYDQFFGNEPFFDQAFFAERIRANGGRALELACGTGRLMLPYLRDGLDVEGLDTSGDMLAILRVKAARLGVKPTLHQRPMQDFDLPARYTCIFCPVNSFQILVTDSDIAAALGCCLKALVPGGELILTIADRPAAWESDWRERRRIVLDDGAQVVIDDQSHPHPAAPRWHWNLRWRVNRGETVEEFIQAFELRDYDATDLLAQFAASGFEGVCERRGYTESKSAKRLQRIVCARRPKA